MATGFSRTLEGGHDAVYDYSCTPCTEDKLNAEASFYCKNCSKLFCDTCIRHHEKILKDHQVLGRTEVAKWGRVKSVIPAVMCEEHPGKEEEMYCGDHDVTCCLICINVYHRGCKKIKHVSEAAKGIQKTPEFQSFLTNAAKTQTSLKHLLDKKAKNTILLQDVRNEITASFKDIRKNFNQSIDYAEKESTTEMDRLLSILQRKVQFDTNICSDFQNEIQKFLDDIKKFRNESNDFTFQCFKRCMRKLFSAQELLSSMGDKDYQLKFTSDVSIEMFQSSLKTLGKFDITPMYLPSDYVYTVNNIQKQNVRTKTDTKKCKISGISQLPDGHVAIVDNNNKKVKLLNCSQFSVIAELDLPPYPYDICTTTKTELVVTVCSGSGNELYSSELHFISAAAGNLTHTRSKQLDHECTGIASHNGQLYVSSIKALYEYSSSGQKLRKIYKDTSCQGVTVCRFAVSDDGNRIYFTNAAQNCLVTIDKSGKQLSVLHDPELNTPTGVCMADNGAVFVCGASSRTVIQVDGEGKKKIAILAKQSDGVHGSVCFDRKLNNCFLDSLTLCLL